MKNSIKLNDRLLGLILFIQRARSYYVSKMEMYDAQGDWYEFVSGEYYSLPIEVFKEAGISQCQHNLDEALQFTVTPQMLNCQESELNKFSTAFYND